MTDAYIVEAVRSPVGRHGGGLAHLHPVDLAAQVLRALVERTGIDPGAVDDVVLGCIDNIGPQSADIARTSWLAAGLPEHVPGVTIDRRCGSSQQAVHFAAATVMAGIDDLVVAGGVQHMSAIPLGASYRAGAEYGFADPLISSDLWGRRYAGGLRSQLAAADEVARGWCLSREDLEAFSIGSHERALAAQEAGHFTAEIVPLAGLGRDEGPRKPDLDKMMSLPPVLEGGLNTAATSSPLSDGAAMLLIASEEGMRRCQLTPRARIHHLSVRGDDPEIMLTAPISATRFALAAADMTLDDVDSIEINEAFASVVLAWQHEFEPDMARVNPNGGAIALGHPIWGEWRSAHDQPPLTSRTNRRPLRSPDDVRGWRAGQRHHSGTGVNVTV